FLEKLSPENQMKACCIGLNKSIDEIFLSLEEIERYKTELLADANPLL
ncbi:18315_t:CDS:1, partial [Funneliformis geosporum]